MVVMMGNKWCGIDVCYIIDIRCTTPIRSIIDTIIDIRCTIPMMHIRSAIPIRAMRHINESLIVEIVFLRAIYLIAITCNK